MAFTPNADHFARVMQNRRPERLPLYEHNISAQFIEQATGTRFADEYNPGGDRNRFMRVFCGFWREMGYDTVSWEVCATAGFPGPHAMSGGKGAVQCRADLEAIDWIGAPDRYWTFAEPLFDALDRELPEGMMAVGGVGNGVFEMAEAFTGLEYLPFLDADEPDVHADLYRRIGDYLVTVWRHFLERYAHRFVACRIGDDLGFKASLLTSPAVVREHIIPQYRRVVELVHAHGKPFLLHSCGRIFDVMDDLLAVGIDAKHSNEDAIAPFDDWIDRYNDRIALLGGIDMDFLCRATPEQVYETTCRLGAAWRQKARGYALGSGNSIPDYVPVDNYLAMVRAGRRIQEEG